MSRRKLLSVAVIANVMIAGAATADTISYADAITTFSKDCGSDIQKLCKGLNLGNGRIADCLSENSARVSPTCKSTYAGIFQSIQRREEAQASYTKVCQRDMARRCSGVKGDGHVLACLIKAEKHVGDGCNQAITDAGWR